MPLYTESGALRTSGGALAQTPASTAPDVTMITSFEGADLTEWTGGAISDGSKSFVTSPVLDGSQALRIDSFESGMYSLPGDGLNAYPGKGDVFDLCKQFAAGSSVSQLWFGVQDDSNHYFIEMDRPDGAFRLRESSAGTLDSVSVTYAQDTWYAARVTWDDGTLGGAEDDITAALVEDPLGSATTVATTATINDATHASHQGVGINVKEFSSGASAVYDYWHIK